MMAPGLQVDAPGYAVTCENSVSSIAPGGSHSRIGGPTVSLAGGCQTQLASTGYRSPR